MTSFTRNLKETLTYWTASESGYGGYSYGTPTTMRCRWEDRVEMFRTPEGDEVASRSVIAVEDDLEVGTYVYLGTSTEADPTDLDNVYQIRQFAKLHDLRGLGYERKAWL